MKARLVATVALAGLVACGGAPSPAPAQGVTLERVLDGDTIEVTIDGGRAERVRLIGINTPERGECLADDATERLATLLRERPLTLQRDVSDRDANGRLLRYVSAGATFVNEAMVLDGLAIAHRYPPDVARSTVLEAAQADARARRRGMWHDAACGRSVAADVVVAHIEADAAGDDSLNLNQEWVDVRNDGSVAVDLTGWGLKDESASHRYVFPDGFRLAAGASVRVHSGCGSDDVASLYWCNVGSAVWNNGGDAAFLLDPAGNIVHSLGSSAPLPAGVRRGLGFTREPAAARSFRSQD